MTAPQTFRVIKKPTSAPKNLPFHAIRVDLSNPPRHNSHPSMVAAGSTSTHGTVFSSTAVVRVAHPQPEEGPSRKGAGHLRRRFGSSAHRHHRPSVGLRRRIARSHPLQGRSAYANLLVLV